jgi:hypothetical protein
MGTRTDKKIVVFLKKNIQKRREGRDEKKQQIKISGI